MFKDKLGELRVQTKCRIQRNGGQKRLQILRFRNSYEGDAIDVSSADAHEIRSFVCVSAQKVELSCLRKITQHASESREPVSMGSHSSNHD